jgi:hypothetical protein
VREDKPMTGMNFLVASLVFLVPVIGGASLIAWIISVFTD